MSSSSAPSISSGGYWSVGARYVHRALRRIIEDIGTFTNPADPLELTGYVIGNPGEGFFGGAVREAVAHLRRARAHA